MGANFQVFLIAIVFASQIIVLSFYAPFRWLRGYALLFTRYPPENYPRLYPVPKEQIERRLAIFRRMHLAIGVGAAVTLVAALIYAESPRQVVGLMSVSLLAQILLPIYIALPLAHRIWKAFRAMPPPNARSAELRQWRITDFVSPLWIGLGLAGPALALTCAAVVYLNWPNTLGVFPTGVVSAAYLLVMVYTLSGRGAFVRADPYMSQEDTFRVRQRRNRHLFVGAAGFGAFGTFLLLYNAQLIRFDGVYMQMAFCVLLQIVVVQLVSQQDWDLDTRDFSVYRADSGAREAP
jgi:hypothetical protein